MKELARSPCAVIRKLLASSSAIAVIMCAPAHAQQTRGGATSGAVPLPTVEVTTESGSSPVTTEGYVPVAASTGSKTKTSILETPQAMSVVTRQQMDNQGAQSLNEALNYTPGIFNSMFGFDPRYNAFRIRGFDATYTGVFRDGLRELNGNLSIFRDEPYGLESIAILRGPSATLYSQSSPGGLVELITKRPKATPMREVEVQIGQYDRYQGNFDITGPVDNDKRWLYRLTGLARESKTSMPFTPDDRLYLAPAFTYQPSLDTTFTMLGEYSRSVYAGTAAFYNTPSGQITSIPFGDPYYNDSVQKQYRVGWALEHRFDDKFTARQNFRYANIDVDYRYVGLFSPSAPGSTIYNRYHEHYLEKVDTAVVDNQLEAKFATGAVTHTVLMGVDYAFADYRRRWGSEFGGGTPPLDISTFNYGAAPIVDPPITNASGLKQNQGGVYIQDQARLGDFLLTLGGRHDWLDRDYYNIGVAGSRQDQHSSSRVGLTYLSPTGLAPYASYSTSFTPVLVVAPTGSAELFEPTTAQGGEIGIKYKPTFANALFTVALFDMDQQNVVAPDPRAMGALRAYAALRSRGIEVEAVTSLANGFNGIFAYTYLDMEITEGPSFVVGNFPSGLPRHQVKVWGDYKPPAGHAFHGFGAGFGVRYIGTSFGDDFNSFKNSDAYVLDGMLSYDLGALNPRWKGAEFKVNVSNILGDQYVTCESGFCYLSENRRVIGSMRYRW